MLSHSRTDEPCVDLHKYTPCLSYAIFHPPVSGRPERQKRLALARVCALVISGLFMHAESGAGM